MSTMNFNDHRNYDVETFASMRAKLKPGMLVYDIGAYEGLTSGFIAEIVGAENVVLIEPTEVNWPNIKAYWEQNGLAMPRATFPGFIQDTDSRMTDPQEEICIGKWPRCATKFPVIDRQRLEFRWLHYKSVDENTASRPALKLDTVAKVLGPPAAIMMDVEGSEFLAMKGAEETLRTHQPLVYISVHPSFMKERFGHDAESLRLFMNALGYTGTLLASDHEEHFLYEKA